MPLLSLSERGGGADDNDDEKDDGDGSDGVNPWTCPKSEFYPVIFKCHRIGEPTRRQRLLISSRDGSITGSCKCEVRWKLFMKLEVFVVKASCPWLTPILKKLGKGPRSTFTM